MTFEQWWDLQKFPVGTKQSDAMFAKRWARAAWDQGHYRAKYIKGKFTLSGPTRIGMFDKRKIERILNPVVRDFKQGESDGIRNLVSE